LVIGRFTPESKVDIEKLKKCVKSNPNLKDIPVICNVDFGHYFP